MYQPHSKVMYVAHPTRLRHKGEEFCDIIRKKGYAPINPFRIGEFKDFEGGPLGRDAALGFSLAIQRLCGTTGFFGVSEGTMGELQDRLQWDKDKNIRVFYGYDPKWNEEYENLKPKYGDLLAELRGKQRMIALVGPSAIGKTYWIEQLKEVFGNRIERVKNMTTRAPRDENDKKYYHIVSREKFEEGVRDNYFLEHDQYLDNYYGSSLDEIKKVLKSSHGIFAITPEGVKALHNCRFEINLSTILFVPESEAVLRKNLERRGIKGLKNQEKYIKKASQFVLSPEIDHHKIVITGTEKDKERILETLGPLLKQV